MKLTEHFTLDELTISQEAARRGIDNTPGPQELANLRKVAAVLEQIRALTGKPIVVSSGYRAPAVNKAVGGSATSAHVKGLAADINCPGIKPAALAAMIKAGNLQFDQLILEYPQSNGWVHIGLSEGRPRMQLLTASTVNGKAKYTSGLNA